VQIFQRQVLEIAPNGSVTPFNILDPDVLSINRIDGPLVCCYSHFDSALGTIYPLASRMSDDDRSVAAGVSFDQAVSSSGRSRGSRAKSQTSRQTFRPCRSRPQRSVARLDSEDGNFEESSWGSEIPVRA